MGKKPVAAGKAKAKAKAPQEPAVPYEPTEREKAALQRLQERRATMRPRPVVKVISQEGGSVNLQITHEDAVTGELLLCESFGVTASAFASLMIEQLGFLSIADGTVSEKTLTRHLAVVHEIEPADGIEALLACQMAAVHMQFMASAGDAVQQSGQRRDATLNQLNKLGRTFTTQLEALKKHRNKGEQKVVVEHRHYHLAPGSQAVFGDVSHGGGVGVGSKNGGQSHERNETDPMRISERPAMLGLVQADGVPVPRPCDERQEGLQVPRWEGGSANGAG